MVYYTYRYLFDKDSVPRKIVIDVDDGRTLDEDNLLFEDFTLEEIACDNDYLVFGTCISSSISFSCAASVGKLAGHELTVNIVIDDHDDAPFVVGKYKVVSDKLATNKRSRKIEACDAMYEVLNKDVAGWYNQILPNADSTVLLEQFRNSFLSYLGIEQRTVSLANDSMLVRKTIDPETLSAKMVFERLCEINGCFGGIDREGKFRYIVLRNQEDAETEDYISCEHEDYVSRAINKLQIRQEEGDIGVIAGTGDNAYIVEDNFLVYGMSTSELTSVANNLLNAISGIEYVPFTMKKKGNPCWEIGDRISIKLTDGTIIKSIVLRRELKGIQSLKDELVAKGVEYRSEKTTGIEKEILQLKGKSNVLERTIEETRSTISDVEKGLTTQIKQNTDSITSEVTRAKDAENLLNTKISQTDDNIKMEVSRLQKEIDGDIKTYNVDYVPTLMNYPAWDFCEEIFCDGTHYCDGIPFTYTDASYSKNARTVVFNTKNFVSYKFVKGENGQWYWREVADSDYSMVMQQISEINIELGSITSTVSEYKRDSDGNYSKLSSKIEQTENSITSEINRATSAEGNLSSRITQTAESLESQISATKIDVKNYADDKAGQAESNAKTDTSNRLKSYSTTVQMNSAIKQSADSITTSVDKKITETKTYADNVASTAESNAKTDTVEKLKSYSTTKEMKSAIEQSEKDINLSINSKITETKTYADDAASDAEKNAKKDTDEKLKSYSTTIEMETALQLRDDAISAKVSQIGGDNSSFGWNLTAEGFQLICNNQTMFLCNKDGIAINGYATTSELAIRDNAISAKVSSVGGKNSSFGWVLTDDGFQLISKDKTMFLCNDQGIAINGYTTTIELNAEKARIEALEADHVTTKQLNAVDGKIDALNSIAITTENLSANSIDAGQIKTGTIDTARLNVKSLFSENIAGSQSLWVNAVWTNALYLYDGASGQKEGFTGAVTYTIGGTRYRLVARKM